MDLQEIECEGMGWIDLHQDRAQLMANFCDDGNGPSVSLNGGKCLEYLNVLLLVASEDSVE